MTQPEQFVGFGGVGNPGPYLRKTRDECIALVQPKTQFALKQNVTACILQKFTETDKAIYASRQYVLTLWPAFIGAIVALAPDPAYMVYDNLWWSVLFCVTSGGLPGLEQGSSPPHHVEAHSEGEGREMCEGWVYDGAQPKVMSKAYAMGEARRGKGHVRMEWVSLFVGVGLWAGFIAYFAITLKPSVGFSYNGDPTKHAIWYYISAAPAILACIFEALQNRVDLYEPVNVVENVGDSLIKGEASARTRSVSVTQSLPQQYYKRVEVRSVFQLWLRVLVHQWRRSRYRILVRDPTAHHIWWFFAIGRAMVGIGRMTVFALGSITMGNIILMPVPDDIWVFVLLMFTTAVPRQLWPVFWTNGHRGADLVVFARNLKVDGALHVR
ncbi:uncharacterized protein KY384_004501 [Bacidia gigantensis]|uniref:uncharacterized protein n=1 Tax=Bacidia gigantensis TaxID=2732470 RepID=UPI001D04F033|nr:uncharacterized protein KY384_004501 [Bacidia gigantensis]KAG8531143.1 hypothetical protein KY384_004501 [Bacidia gigantensis]